MTWFFNSLGAPAHTWIIISFPFYTHLKMASIQQMRKKPKHWNLFLKINKSLRL